VALCGLDFVAHQGEGIVILGPNGAGKSTLLFHLLGLLRPDEGAVSVLGRDPAREFDAIQPHLGVLVQNVDEQLLGPTVGDDVGFSARNAGYDPAEAEIRAERAMRRLGIYHLASRVVHYLSGGEKRKVALAGALVTDPQILILDEPFEGLDPRSRGDLVSLLRELREENGLTLILTTHDVDLVPKLADTVYVLAEGGQIIARGTPEEVFRRREILRVSNIEAPALTLLFHRLHEAGLDLGSPTDMDDAVRRLSAIAAGERPRQPS
jgi:cobalt/nickel transport system ATP-binding protein